MDDLDGSPDTRPPDSRTCTRTPGYLDHEKSGPESRDRIQPETYVPSRDEKPCTAQGKTHLHASKSISRTTCGTSEQESETHDKASMKEFVVYQNVLHYLCSLSFGGFGFSRVEYELLAVRDHSSRPVESYTTTTFCGMTAARSSPGQISLDTHCQLTVWNDPRIQH